MRKWMKSFAVAGHRARGLVVFCAVSAAALAVSNTSALAAVEINIDKSAQVLTVAVDGQSKYRWPISSGVPAHETPNGTFRAFRMEADHYSKEWDDAPMPHSIFFTKLGHAIHGTDSVSRLGSPASHGCVRLSRANAATLYALVQKEGVLNTTVTLTGSSQVAIARARQRNDQMIARNDSAQRAPMHLTPQATASQSDGYVDQQQSVQAYRPAYPGQSFGMQQSYSSSDDYYYAQQQAYPVRRGFYYRQ
jgi:L,D-transpeptidase catalytic domain